MDERKIAIVYDWVDKWGGVERVLLTLHDLFPKADFFTSYTDLKKAQWATELKINSSFLQSFPGFIKHSRVLSTPLYPYAFESFDFSSYDVVISISSSFAKGIVTTSKTKHVSYILTPSRFLWISPKEYLTNALLKKASLSFKRWDFAAAQRSDIVLSLSETTRNRVKKYYKRDSTVIYPPFDAGYWKKIGVGAKKNTSKKFFLLVSRLEPYKRVDLAIGAFNQLHDRLIIVGSGSQESRLRRKAHENIVFMSGLSDKELAGLYMSAETLIVPQEEDFGYTPLEAVYLGLPVIAYKKGGATETIRDGKTGIFFEDQTQESLVAAVERFKKVSYNLKDSAKKFGKESVEAFSLENFRRRFLEEIKSTYQ